MKRLLVFAFALSLLSTGCSPGSPATPPNPPQGGQMPTSTQTRMISFLQTKGKAVAQPLIAALAAYYQSHQTYPASLAELGQAELSSQFDLTDFSDAKNPEVSPSVYKPDTTPVLYQIDYSPFKSEGFSLSIHYTIFGLGSIGYESSSGQWVEGTTFL